ncbi:hypothetical protein IAQ61_010240, partial [Plenodomus lingam]|uniref:uncharacterized protein n=1 Tax=Leptosphaeria maculans TaxID=5022 RepID=UPI00332FA971
LWIRIIEGGVCDGQTSLCDRYYESETERGRRVRMDWIVCAPIHYFRRPSGWKGHRQSSSNRRLPPPPCCSCRPCAASGSMECVHLCDRQPPTGIPLHGLQPPVPCSTSRV